MSETYEHAARLEAVPPDNEVLNQVAEDVPVEDITSPETQSIIDSMFRFAYGEQGDINRRTLVGLAAPQLGISKRIVIIGVTAAGFGEQPDLEEFINPVIVSKSDETEPGREGCFSTDNVCGIVDRAKSVTIRGFDRTAREVERVLAEFPAHVAQHELDHLDGVRFPDRITDDKRLHWVEREKFGEYRLHWQTWAELCPREKWEEIRSGKL